MKKSKKFSLWLVLLIFLTLAGKQVYQKLTTSLRQSPGKPKQEPVAVKVAPVARKTLSEVSLFTGSIFPQSRFVIAPKVAGRLEKLLVDVGDPIKKGQLVALLESQEYQEELEASRAELEVARANLSEAEINLEQARRELERTKLLREKKIASQSELDETESTYRAREARYKVALAQLEQKKAAVRAAEVRLSFTRIEAWWENGSDTRVVGERFVDVGAMLRANDSIISILEIDTIKAILQVAEEDFFRLRVGWPVVLTTDSLPGKTFAGRIVRLAPGLKEESRAGQAEVTVSNPGHLLRPGVFVRAEIELAQHEKSTVVPLSALAKRDGNQGVFLVDTREKKVRFVPVETGLETEEEVEIISPPLQGFVVTLGHHLLSDGSPVSLPGESETNSTQSLSREK
ncbi:MAG: efflux RND transporter periplasmic adaptor subunit [Candidatus Omnitrophica bacterium]|nr:efflux RND transporter periplasmic adaptor subunit [Candidatus Omnitrophota bacterium]